MNQRQVEESDWKKFRKIASELRERYLERVNREIAAIFSNHEGTPTDQFWDVEGRIQKEARIVRDCLDDHRRSSMVMKMLVMQGHGMLADKDLDGFSEELSERLKNSKDL